MRSRVCIKITKQRSVDAIIYCAGRQLIKVIKYTLYF